ncbi:MAG: hypothetical protein QM723_31125 [Myxococcaceae bacterium]
MRKLLVVPKALAVTLFACGSPHSIDAGTDAGTDGGTMDAGSDAGFDGGTDGGADAGCDCMGMCPQVDCFPFQDQDGGMICECAI